MDSSCSDKETGHLLHAYELGLLSEEETEKFELHLMKCNDCVARLQDPSRLAELLGTDRIVRAELSRLAGEQLQQDSRLKRLAGYLWPGAPLPFRPAVSLIIILLMIYPACLGLMDLFSPKVVSVREIGLVQNRSTSVESFQIHPGEAVVLTFVCHDCEQGGRYRVTVVSDAGKTLYSNPSFNTFDRFQTGRLLLPASLLQPGVYHLSVSPEDGPDSASLEQYDYRLVQ